MRKRKEGDIVRAVMDYLYCKQYFCWRQNNVGVYDQKNQCYRKNRNTTKGVPDIFVLRNGVLIGLECKMPTGHQSIEQQQFQNKMLANGARYFIIRELNDVVEIGL